VSYNNVVYVAPKGNACYDMTWTHIAFYCIVWSAMVLYGIVLCCNVLCAVVCVCIVWYGCAWYDTVCAWLYHTVPCYCILLMSVMWLAFVMWMY